MWRRRELFPELRAHRRAMAALGRVVEAVLADRGQVRWW